MEQERIYFEHTLQLAKPFGNISLKISNNSVKLGKGVLPLTDISGFSYGDTLMKYLGINGAKTFYLTVFSKNQNPIKFNFVRQAYQDHETISQGLIKAVWEVVGKDILADYIAKLKNNETISLHDGKIIITPVGLNLKDHSIFNNRTTSINWNDLTWELAYGELRIKSKENNNNFSYSIINTENILILVELIKWKEYHWLNVANITTLKKPN